MKKLKLSIIIPVYNIEKYISQCIDSVIANNFKNYEIILVNDGSTDNSPTICKDYQKRYPKIVRLINQKNAGLSAARNTGIKHASGEYIMFIDGDDYLLQNDHISRIVSEASEDIVQYQYAQYYERNDKLQYPGKLNEHTFSDENIYITMNTLLEAGIFSTCAWDKLIRKKLIDDNKILFKEGLLSEDIEWMLRLYPFVNSIKIVNEVIYAYRQGRTGSITRKIGSKNIKDLFNIINHWYSFKYEDETQQKVYLSFLAYHYIILLTHISSSNCSKQLRKEILSIKDIIKYDSHPKVRMCNKVSKMVGLRLSIIIFRTYRVLKNKGIVKI